MKKLDYDKLTDEQIELIRNISKPLGIGGEKPLTDLILSIDPELEKAEKHEIENIWVSEETGEVSHETGTYALESPGEIPAKLSALTLIVLDALDKNGDLGWLMDLLKDKSYRGSFEVEGYPDFNDDETIDEESLKEVYGPKEEKFVIVGYSTDRGVGVNCNIGPFDTEEDAEDYAGAKGYGSPDILPLTSVRCDQDGKWL